MRVCRTVHLSSIGKDFTESFIDAEILFGLFEH